MCWRCRGLIYYPPGQEEAKCDSCGTVVDTKVNNQDSINSEGKE